MSDPRIEIKGLSTGQARRIADIGDALAAKGLKVVAFLDPRDYVLAADRCPGCGCQREGGHCYCCFPVWGYGDRWQAERHGEGFRPDARRMDEEGL